MRSSIKRIHFLILIFAICNCTNKNQQISPKLEIPIAAFTFTISDDGTVSFVNNSKNATEYFWKFGNGEVSKDNNPKITYQKNGLFDVKLVVSNSDLKDSLMKQVQITNITYSNKDNIFICDDDGNCTLFDANRGTERWTINIKDAYFASSPTYYNGLLFICTNTYPKGKVIAIDIETGKTKWEYLAKSSISSSPIAFDSKIFVVSTGWDNGTLYCIDANNGNLFWEVKDVELKDSSPTIKEDKIYVGTDSGLLIADIKNGYPIRLIRGTSGLIKNQSNLRIKNIKGEDAYHSSPCFSGDLIYHCSSSDNFQTSDLMVYNSNKQTNTKLLKLSPSTNSSPSVSNNYLLINAVNRLIAFDIISKKIVWEYNYNLTISNKLYFDSSPIIVGNKVFTVGAETLFAINLLTGKEMWKYGKDIQTSPTYYNSILYVGTINKLVAIDTNTGILKWETPIKNNGWSREPSPLVISSNGSPYHSGISGAQQ